MRESLHRRGDAFANVPSTEAEVCGGETWRVLFASSLRGAGVAHPLRKDAGPFSSSPQGGEELLPCPSAPAAMPQRQNASERPARPAGAWLLGHEVIVCCFSKPMGLMSTLAMPG